MTIDEIVQFYRDNGYARAESFVPAEEIDKLCALHEKAYHGLTPMPVDISNISMTMQADVSVKLLDAAKADIVADQDQMVAAIKASGKFMEDIVDGQSVMRHVEYFNPRKDMPELLDTSYYKNGIDVTARIMEVAPKELRLRGGFLSKPPGFGPTSWHQDETFNPPDKMYDGVIVWVALEDASVENGCLRVVPKSHKGPLRPHPRVGRAELLPEDQANAISVPVPAGGAVLLSSRVLHGSNPNQSARQRRAVSFLFHIPRTRVRA